MLNCRQHGDQLPSSPGCLWTIAPLLEAPSRWSLMDGCSCESEDHQQWMPNLCWEKILASTKLRHPRHRPFLRQNSNAGDLASGLVRPRSAAAVGLGVVVAVAAADWELP
mmetsp:Transcript_28375/g.94206  ORF Transcript_28375/g.94206 Transcript_28375/m.94206 type:complete len:110 (+) Transcript_28375:142-471(+)